MNKPQNIYDNQIFFDGYKKLRENPDSANILEEKPALFSLAPDLTGKAVLDLGCGYGENCAEFKRLGASRVVGIDISEKMLEVAKKENTEIEFIRADMSDLSRVDGRFDVVFSSLAVHYIKDFDSFVAGVGRVLVDGGVFIFSQEHPLTTAPPAGANWTRDENKNVLHYNLMGYMRSFLAFTIIDSGNLFALQFTRTGSGKGAGRNPASCEEGGNPLTLYNRRLSDYINALAGAGMVAVRVVEETNKETMERDCEFSSQYYLFLVHVIFIQYNADFHPLSLCQTNVFSSLTYSPYSSAPS